MAARFKLVTAADFTFRKLKAGEPVIITDTNKLVIPVTDGTGIVLALSDLADVGATAAETETALTALGNRATALEGDVTALEGAVTSLDARVTALEPEPEE